MPVQSFSIKDSNQLILLQLARQAIASKTSGEKLPAFHSNDPEIKTPSAVFVTLTRDGKLRGCIGTTEPLWPMAEAVTRMAVAAAAEDYRFPPVTEKELNDIRIEISVLSPLARVKNSDEIRQNVHGVVARRNGRSGLFLPQVWEHFSKKEDFLFELCRQKAGLEPDAWRDPETELYVFTVFAFQDQ